MLSLGFKTEYIHVYFFSSQFLISLIVIFDLVVVLVIKKDVFWFTRMNVVSVKLNNSFLKCI